MQLEELEQQWRWLDQKLDQSLALESELLRRAVVQPARKRINRLAFWPAVDLVLCAAVLLWFGAFLGDHGRDWRLAAPAIAVMICAIVLLADSIRQLVLVAELDWGGPVAEIQTSLQRLRVAKIRQFKWVILLAPLVGFCGLVVGLHALFDWLSEGRVHVYDKLNPWWIAANYAFGVLFVPLGYLVARGLAKRCHHRSWWKGVLDGIAGNSLKAAALDVERWASLQQEEFSS